MGLEAARVMNIDRDALVQAFLVDSEENFTAMEESLMALEARPDDPEILRAIFRGAHNMKGNASTIEFREMADLAHLVEDLLDQLRKQTQTATPELVTLLLRSVDVMRRMAPTAVTMEGMAKAPSELVAELEAYKARAGAAPPVPTATAAPPATLAELPVMAATPAVAAAPASPVPPTPPGPPRAPAAASGGQPEAARVRTLRVDVDRLDQILTLVGEIAIARGRLLGALEREAAGATAQAIEIHRESDRLFLDLQDLVLKIRMVPLGPSCRQYARTVRDLAASHGKLARLVVEGGEVEVDTAVIEHLRDPLTHIVRNAISHAIESPAERRGIGKDPCGLINIRARRDASSIVLQVIDDGRGIDRNRVLEVARARGLVPVGETPRDDELLRLIFEPGFSTAAEVGDLSGRGFGMDIVRRHLEALRGTVDVESAVARGTTFTLRIPLTLAIIPGFAIKAGEETYVLPMESVLECVDMPLDLRVSPEGLAVLPLRGHPLPCLRLREFFRIQAAPSTRENVVVVRIGDGMAGIIVDSLEGETQAVVKPLGRYLGDLAGIAGSTILGSGGVALILDVPVILRNASAVGAGA
jgi:two-component system, chemotaxis family, sensor kinase CheA